MNIASNKSNFELTPTFISLTKAIGFYDDLLKKNNLALIRGENESYCFVYPDYLSKTQDFLMYIRNGKINLYGKNPKKEGSELVKIAPSFCKKIQIYPSEDIINGINYLEHVINDFHEMFYKIVNTYDYLTTYNPSTNYDALLDIKTGKHEYTHLSISNKEFFNLYNTSKEVIKGVS